MSSDSNFDPEKGHESQIFSSLQECRDILMNAPVGIFVTTPEGRFLAANPALAKMFGLSDTDEVIHTIHDIGTQVYLHPEDRNEFLRLLERDGEVVNYEYQVRRWDGSIFWTSTNARAVRDDTGKIIQCQGYSTDITERKLTAKALHEEQVMQKLLMHLATDFINIPLENMNQALNSMLEAVGKFIRVDRGYIFRHEYVHRVTTNTHEWCADGITSEMNKLQAVPFDFFPGILEAHQKGEVVHIPDVSQMPKDEALRSVLEQQGIQSLIVLPLLHESMCIGFVGFDSVREKRSFTDPELDLLKVLAEIISNVILRQQAEKELFDARHRLDLTLRGTNTGLWDWNIQDEEIFINEQWAKILGYTLQELQPLSFQSWMNICHPDDLAVSNALLEKHLAGHTETYECEIRMQHKDGSWIWILDRGKVVEWDNNNSPLHMTGTHTDITEIKKYAEQLQYLSLHDQLTGLYNRTYFDNELHRMQKSREYPISIICCDVDGLKLINDTMGHQYGDKLLQSSAQALQVCFRESDVLTRVGGDEFVALLPRTSFEDGKKIMHRIRSMVHKYNQAHDGHMPLSLSIGMATADDKEDLLEEIYKIADDRMYEDKLQNRDRFSSLLVSSFRDSLHKHYFPSAESAQQVEDVCCKLGQKSGLSSSRLSSLALLSRVYDLGMVTLSRDIVCKQGPLTRDEWAAMSQHPQKGYRIAAACKDLQHVADFILKYHEQWDGQGYPVGLAGEEIPIECRIVAIASAFVAMTNDRPYQDAMSADEALTELTKKAGTQFDPQLVETFVQIMSSEIESM